MNASRSQEVWTDLQTISKIRLPTFSTRELKPVLGNSTGRTELLSAFVVNFMISFSTGSTLG
jgi:hypothetical protein